MRFMYEDEGQKHEFQLRPGEFKIGRDPSCDIATTNRSVSRKHIVVTVKGTTVMARDENSGNGMFVNDVRMPEAVLKNGDVLRAGKFALTFQGEDVDGTIVGTGGADQEGTMVEGGAAAPPPPRRAPSASQREAAGHKTAPLDEVRDELERMAAAPPPPKKAKSAPAPAAEPGPPAKLKVTKGMSPSVRDLKGRVSLGTQDDNSLVLTGDGISRNHSEIVVKDGKWVVRDLASRNGTWVNGKKIDEHVLGDGDSIQIGSVALAFVSTASTPAAPAAPPAAAREVAAAPPPSKPAASPADAAKKKKMKIIAIAAVGFIGLIGALAMINPEEGGGGGGGGGAGGGGQSTAAAFKKEAEAAWTEVIGAIDNREYSGASRALTPLRAVYKQYGQDDAEVKAWAKVIDAYLASGANFVNLNGQGWDELKTTLEAAANAGPFASEYAGGAAEWCGRCKGVWAEISQGQEAESSKRWADAVAHYGAVKETHSVYGKTAKDAKKNVMELWKQDYMTKLNQFDTAADYEQCLATYKDMCKNIPEAKRDQKLAVRSDSWTANVAAAKRKRAAEQLIGQGKYEEALRELDQAITTDEKLVAEIGKLREQAESGGMISEVTKLYREGKADEALARLGEVAEGTVLAQLKQKITKVLNAYKDALSAEERKDFATAKRWWTEIVSSEEDPQNFYRLAAEQKAGFDPTTKAADLVQQADAKMSEDDYVAARELAEQALVYVPGYEAAQKIVSVVVKEAETRYRMLYANWRQMSAEEALKKAQIIRGMFRASDGSAWNRLNELIERIQKEGK